MIDLQPAIRAVILNNAKIIEILPNYNGSKPVFSRRPVPNDSPFPLILISPIVTDVTNDFLTCQRRTLTYDILVYGSNDTAENFRNVEKIANELTTTFHRMSKFAINMPPNSSFIQSTASAPMSAPVDDNHNVGRVVIVKFDVML